jgi:hypothetical protein
MPKTAVGLFKNPNAANDVVPEIAAAGLPRNEIRTVGEPLNLGVDGVLSIGRIDFEVDLFRELSRMGASRAEAQAYVDGVRRGGVLVFATGPDQIVDKAVEIMNRYGAVETGEEAATEPHLHSAPHSVYAGVTSVRESPVQAGRIRQSGGGAAFFVW